MIPVSIRVLVVDDEVLAREKITGFLASEPDVEVVGECGNAKEAIRTAEQLRPDVIFLDVRIGEMDGFSVVEAIQKLELNPFPAVIFTTAYDEYALRAFDAQAFDYLLKPFTRERFQVALQRVRAMVQASKTGELAVRMASILKDINTNQRYLDRLVFKDRGRIIFLRATEIEWIEAEGNYVRIHAGRESHLLRETISNLEASLNPELFLRIHRSTIVNVRYVKEMQAWSTEGESIVIMRDGTQLTLSRGYRSKIANLVRT
jgi:two-component system, LytTR family, response regulator